MLNKGAAPNMCWDELRFRLAREPGSAHSIAFVSQDAFLFDGTVGDNQIWQFRGWS